MKTFRAHLPYRTSLAAWAAGAALLLCLPATAAAHHIEKHFAVAEKPVVILHNPNGFITVKSWPKREVLVSADHAGNKVEVDALQNGNRIEVVTHLLSENISPNELRADYEISVPDDAQLQIHNDAGTVVVTDVMGDTAVETVAAGVQLENAGGYLTVSTAGGSFDCVRCYGRVEARSISGNLRAFDNRSSNIHFQTATGNIFFQGDFLANGTYSLKTYSGAIEVRYSPGASFDLSATSINGKVINEAKLKPPAHSSQQGPRYSRSLFGTFNAGQAKVELTSISGTISIRKRN